MEPSVIVKCGENLHQHETSMLSVFLHQDQVVQGQLLQGGTSIERWDTQGCAGMEVWPERCV